MGVFGHAAGCENDPLLDTLLALRRRPLVVLLVGDERERRNDDTVAV